MTRAQRVGDYSSLDPAQVVLRDTDRLVYRLQDAPTAGFSDPKVIRGISTRFSKPHFTHGGISCKRFSDPKVIRGISTSGMA